jgi:hypothetical protein
MVADSHYKNQYTALYNHSSKTEDSHTKCEKVDISWPKLVEDFTKRDISYVSDRLPALSGLASFIGQHIEGKYLAGIWEQNIHRELLWHSKESGSTFFGSLPEISGRRHPAYYAPSWSWASVTGPVSFPEEAKLQFLGTVISAECSPSGANPFGPVRSGHLKISALVASVKVERRTHMNNRTKKWQVRYFAKAGRFEEKVSPDIGPDGAEFNTEEQHKLLFLATDDVWASGLLLRGSKIMDEAYERIGFVSCARMNWKTWSTVTKKETLTMV